MSPQFNAVAENFTEAHLDSQSPVPILQAPTVNKRGKKNLFIASDEQFLEQEESKGRPPPVHENANLEEASPDMHRRDDFDDQEELQAKSVSPMVKPTPGKSMFHFGSFVDSQKTQSLSPDKNLRLQPTSPDGEAMILPGNKHQIQHSQPPSGLTLESEEPTQPRVEERKKRPQMGLMIEDSQGEEDSRDSDGQNSPELIIPKHSRAARHQAGANMQLNTSTQPQLHTRSKPALAFGGGGLKGKGLNI